MNILHLRASNFYGGPERQLHFHARYALERGLAITVGSFTENSHPPEFLQIISGDGIHTHSFGIRNAYDYKSVVLIRSYLKKHDIDLLCTHDYRSGILGFIATRLTSTRWVAFSRGRTTENLKVRLYHLIDKILVRFADHIVAVSESERERLTRLSVPKSKISVVHNSININTAAEINPIDLRKKFGFPQDSVICVAAGRFSHEKGQEYLVTAAELAMKRDPRLRFLIFGDGPDLNKIAAMISQAGCEGKILCPGFQKNLPGYIKGADIFINPSLSEGLPNVVLEAMAMDVPVVATSVGGVPEIIEGGSNGILVPPADPKALSDALLDMACRPQKDEMIKTAKETIRTKYSFDVQMDKMEKIYGLFRHGIHSKREGT